MLWWPGEVCRTEENSLLLFVIKFTMFAPVRYFLDTVFTFLFIYWCEYWCSCCCRCWCFFCYWNSLSLKLYLLLKLSIIEAIINTLLLKLSYYWNSLLSKALLLKLSLIETLYYWNYHWNSLLLLKLSITETGLLLKHHNISNIETVYY